MRSMRAIHYGRLLAAFAALACVAAPLAAQYPSGGMEPGRGGMGGMGGRGGRGGMMGRRGERPDFITPAELEGPIAPDTLRQVVAANDDEMARYTRMYQNQMAQTKAERDSARATLQAMRTAFQGGDRDAARANAATLKPLGDEIRKSDAAFEKTTLGLLTKDQQKQYKKWKDARKKAADDERRQRMEGGTDGMGGRPGGFR